jgi:hypothetical protein
VTANSPTKTLTYVCVGEGEPDKQDAWIKRMHQKNSPSLKGKGVNQTSIALRSETCLVALRDILPLVRC